MAVLRALALIVALALGAHSAEILSEIDAHLLKVLQPVSRSSSSEWMELHAHNVAELEKFRSAFKRPALIVYGDSITEAYLGTSMGVPRPEYQPSKTAWASVVLKDHPTAEIFSIAGDKTMHLLWRLRNGEGPKGVNPSVMAVFIGTNDLTHLAHMDSKENATEVAHTALLGLKGVVRELQQQAPTSQICIFGVLPLAPIRTNVTLVPHVRAMNLQLERWVSDDLASRYVHYNDCSWSFLRPPEYTELDLDLMPDGIHPRGKGAEDLLRCMSRAMESALIAATVAGG